MENWRYVIALKINKIIELHIIFIFSFHKISPIRKKIRPKMHILDFSLFFSLALQENKRNQI